MHTSQAQEGIRFAHLPEPPAPSTWTTTQTVDPAPTPFGFEDERSQLLRQAGA
ncbi:hypothetical protein [Angustibacter aerolatus]